MSLFLDVSIQAQSIVEAAWARATANRERLRRRLDVQAVREEAAVNRINGRSTGPGWELRYTTPTPLQYRPDEPVAYPISRPPLTAASLEFGWFFDVVNATGLDSPRGFEDITYIASGNGAAVVSFDLGFVEQYDRIGAVLPYPGGQGFIYYVAKVPTVTGSADFPLIEKAFLVTHTAVTEVTLIGYPYEEEANPSRVYTPEELFWFSNQVGYEGEIINLPGLVGGLAFTPKDYVKLRLLRGEVLADILAAAPGDEIWGAEVISIPVAARDGVAVPSVIPPGDFTSGSWNPLPVWDGGQPAHCNSELALLGYPP